MGELKELAPLERPEEVTRGKTAREALWALRKTLEWGFKGLRESVDDGFASVVNALQRNAVSSEALTRALEKMNPPAAAPLPTRSVLPTIEPTERVEAWDYCERILKAHPEGVTSQFIQEQAGARAFLGPSEIAPGNAAISSALSRWDRPNDPERRVIGERKGGRFLTYVLAARRP